MDFIVKVLETRWVKLLAFFQSTTRKCTLPLLNELFLHYGLPRRLISDNGLQFVSNAMQQLCHLLDIKQSKISVYTPQANPVDRKSRDLNPRLLFLVGDDHSSSGESLSAISFAMNSAKCENTDLTTRIFSSHVRTLDDDDG